MLFNLSLKNFRKSIRDYSIYFFTLILGVAVFYIFNAIETQSAMLEVSRTKENILQIMNSILEGVSGDFFYFGIPDCICQQLYAETAEKGVWNLSDSWHEEAAGGRDSLAGNRVYGDDFSGGRAYHRNWTVPVYVSFGVQPL